MTSTVVHVLGAGNRRAGSVTLGLLIGGAVLLPLLLLIFSFAAGGLASAALGLMLGLIFDLLAVVLVLGVVSHKVTSRRQRALTRSVAELGKEVSRVDTSQTELVARTVNLEIVIGDQSETLKRQTSPPAALRTTVGAAATEVGNRLQATQNLFALVSPQGLVPPMVGFVAAPDVLLVLVQRFLSLRPSLAIECGSGTSTLFLALAAQQYGVDCRLVSLEHDRAYAAATRALVAEHGVSHLVDVREAPLVPTPLTDHPGPWYDPAAFHDLHDIGLAFVDGPPGDVSPQARYPMVPLLADRLADTCTILLDDMRRADEQAVAKRWRTQLEGFHYRYLPLIRGAGEFTRGC